HKERIKALKTDVDVLTLSATPIPRTLQLSLVGLRDMSVIETPPADRYPIQTYIVEFNDAILTQAIRRELDRGGQIYIIHNRVSELNELAAHIQTLVPEARLAIAHGRSTDRRLEETMMAFVNQEYDILICTTIVETGLDIPNVNTLIVHHADRFGLSQLYQLRGRVGRSKRIAYAYLTYERNKMLTDIAEKRLNTLKEYTALGSGYRIAMKDLELRGAGNILGAEQHGHVADVGFALYMQLLDEAIRKQSGQAVKEKHTVELDVHMNAFLSKTYIPDDGMRLGMYKRLEQAESAEELAALSDELQDRFGLFDEPLVNLLALVSLKLLAMELGIRSIKQRHNQLELMFYPDTPISMPVLMAYVQSYKNITIGNQSGELIVKLTLLKERLTATYVDSIKERLKGMQKIAVVD
ncbi:MAG: TRCF domain-containing protein, partial [Peptococcus niger]